MNLAIIGSGNLGKSFLKGLLESGTVEPNEIIASDPDREKLKELEELGVETTTDNDEAAKSDVIFIAVKPEVISKVLDELRLSDEKLLVSLAAGVSTDYLEKHTEARTIRVMPNICSKSGEMASAYTLGRKATEDDEDLVREILNRMGLSIKIEEELMDAVTGLSGSGPAYVFMVIEAMKKAGEDLGIPEDESLKLAAQTVKGSGELVLESEDSLEELVDMVCSPKGTTIEGVKELEERKVQEALEEAVRSAARRSKELSK